MQYFPFQIKTGTPRTATARNKLDAISGRALDDLIHVRPLVEHSA